MDNFTEKMATNPMFLFFFSEILWRLLANMIFTFFLHVYNINDINLLYKIYLHGNKYSFLSFDD